MVRGIPSWAHPGIIIGADSRPDNRSHGHFWLDKTPSGSWCWIGCNPVHGTYHFEAHWAVPVGELPPTQQVISRLHAFVLLWGLPHFRAGEPVSREDSITVETALAALAQHPQAQLDPNDRRRVPVMDVYFRAQSGGMHSWVSARHGDLLHTGIRQSRELDRLRDRLASAQMLATWAHPDGVAWGRPATHLPMPQQITLPENTP